MSNQILNNSNSDNIIPDIAIKIKELSATKQVLLKMIMQMYPMSIDPTLKVYTNPLVRLLQSIINIFKIASYPVIFFYRILQIII